jgi:hypothetical protein
VEMAIDGRPTLTLHAGDGFLIRPGTHAVHLHRRGRAATGLVHRGAGRPVRRPALFATRPSRPADPVPGPACSLPC